MMNEIHSIMDELWIFINHFILEWHTKIYIYIYWPSYEFFLMINLKIPNTYFIIYVKVEYYMSIEKIFFDKRSLDIFTKYISFMNFVHLGISFLTMEESIETKFVKEWTNEYHVWRICMSKAN
jgi:hypothetical protein